jgi:hypothetical protein
MRSAARSAAVALVYCVIASSLVRELNGRSPCA